MNCVKCNGSNLELIDAKDQAKNLFLLGCVLFPLFFIFWPMALITMRAKSVYKCKECKKIFPIKG